MNATADMPEVDRTLDVQGLECPLPVLRARVELRRMKAGEVLHVIATDPLAPLDFRAFCARSGHELVRLDEADERVDIFVRRRESD